MLAFLIFQRRTVDQRRNNLCHETWGNSDGEVGHFCINGYNSYKSVVYVSYQLAEVYVSYQLAEVNSIEMTYYYQLIYIYSCSTLRDTLLYLSRYPEKMYEKACAPVEVSDQTVQPRSLLRVLGDGHVMDSQGSNVCQVGI